ncbi:MAG: GvpL/GvpF family gas vesicle protein [Candidatus Marinimicrobia bacterium]|nr:GvpL/GvpF family gas vesicle protein [Candidatus Neomarinimicrobiota bacterium]
MATSKGYYLYGFTNCKKYKDIQKDSVAGGSSVQNIPFRGIGLLYNTVNGKEVKPSRNNLMAHQKILESMMKEYCVLPVKFGTVAQSKGALYNGIKNNISTIRGNLKVLKGKKELNIKASWEKSFIYDYILKNYSDIKKFKNRVEKLKGTQKHHNKIELGKMIERALLKENEKEAEKIIKELSPSFIKYKKSKVFGELMFLNLSVLVKDKAESLLDELVNEAAENREDKVKFKYTGPSPPASFVNIHLKF